MFSPHLRKFDWLLFGSVIGLTVIGLSVIYGTSLGADGAPADLGNFWKQLTFACLGITIVFFISAFHYRQLAVLSRVLYVAAMAMLVIVLMVGNTVNGAKSWFVLGGFGVQPVELVKICLVVYLARFFSDYARHPAGLKQIIGSGSVVAGAIVLVLLQPDLGSALLLAVVWGLLLLISGIRASHLMVIIAVVIMTAVVSWLLVLKPYQKARILVFFNPSLDTTGEGYNVNQSVVAIGSGGLFGKGIGSGSQSQLRFLPERQNDFIFAVIGEELGFFGVVVLLGLFGIFFYRGYEMVKLAQDDFTVFLVIGLMLSVAVEVLVNVGGNLRLVPVTGVTLPFVSYGGSSLLVKYLMLGILESVAVRQ